MLHLTTRMYSSCCVVAQIRSFVAYCSPRIDTLRIHFFEIGHNGINLTAAMNVLGLTETFADLRVRIQITRMTGSLHVWVSSGTSAPSLAMSVPGRLAATTILLNGPGSALSHSFAHKIATRTGQVVYACIDLPKDAEILSCAIAKRVIGVIESMQSGQSTSIQP